LKRWLTGLTYGFDGVRISFDDDAAAGYDMIARVKAEVSKSRTDADVAIRLQKGLTKKPSETCATK